MIGRTISHYKILEKLGEGGMGVVYKAEDTKLERPVALKFLARHALDDKEEKARFVREAVAAAALSHPNICTIHEIDEAEDLTFIAMEFVEGKSLKRLIAQGSLEPGDAVDLALQVARGLQEAHEKGIIHRDIKPANMMVARNGRVKIMDFGVAKPVGAPKLTRTGTSLGTVAYMSPEQARGEDVDGRTDIWSLGVVMYEMLCGQLPFRGEYEQAVVYQILNESPRALADLRPGLPAGLDAVVEKALVKDPGGRYRGAREMIADLRALRKAAAASGRAEAATGARGRAEEAAADEASPSIAVLPFANISPDPENEYFGDGLAEELINALTRVRGLRVAARTSAFRFRGKEEDIREIGAKLNVTSLLEGSVRRAGDRVRVTAQLINVADGYHLWSQRYDREMEDIFAIQDEITAAIVKELEVKLMYKTGTPIVKRDTDNLDAYSLYLKGRYYWHSLTAEGWVKSKKLFERAIELDPSFARAHAWLAIHYGSQAFWGDLAPREACARARELAERTMRLDPEVSETHAVLGVLSTTYDWDWKTGEKFMRRAIELDPAEAMNHVNYALMLMIHECPDEAMAEADMARKLDPLSPVINAWTGVMPCYVGRYDQALKLLEEGLALDPGYWQSHYGLSCAHLFGEEFDKAVSSAKEAVDLSGGTQIALMTLTCAHYLSGNRSEGDRQFEALKERARRGYVHSSFLATIHWVRREPDEALRWTGKAIEERDCWLCWHEIDPPCLRLADPRILALLKKAGL